ncbi:hypothetical protein IXO189_04190, partial [Xanthomonas oryzae pv. oryzae]
MDEVRRLARANALSLWEAAMLCTQQNPPAARPTPASATFLTPVSQPHAETAAIDLASASNHLLTR